MHTEGSHSAFRWRMHIALLDGLIGMIVAHMFLHNRRLLDRTSTPNDCPAPLLDAPHRKPCASPTCARTRKSNDMDIY